MINKNSRIYVAGHTGLVGSAIIRKLKQYGYKKIITAKRNVLDLTDQKKTFNFLKKEKPDFIFICAAKVGGILANNTYRGQFIFENLQIQNNLIHGAYKNNIKRLIFLGSSCVYPRMCKQPIKENYLLNDSLEKTNEPYAIAKIAGIKLCSTLKKQYGFDAISLMPTNLYGPGDNYHLNNSHVMPALISKFYKAKMNNEKEVFCWGTGSPKREFLYVDDLADAIVFVLENISSKNQLINDGGLSIDGILNIGTGIDISIKELAKLISSELKYEGEIRWDSSKPNGTPRKLLDVSKSNELGWKSKISLEEGIKLTIDNFIKEYENKSLRI